MMISFFANMENVGTGRRRRAGVDDGGVVSEYCVGVGGGVGAAPMGGEVDEVVMERLREGHRLRVMGDGGGGRPIRPRWAGAEILWLPLSSPLFCLLL
jgi:hypothetical protein